MGLVTAFADGFLAYHIDVGVDDGRAPDVARTIKGWKTAFRAQGTWPGFPQTMADQLSGLGGVTSVVCEGPQSSLLIPLRMVRGGTGADCQMSSVLGTGAVTDAIDDCLMRWGIAVSGRRLDDVDSPIEISIREPGGQHESVRLYPASRNRYRSRLAAPETLPEQFLCNRFNKGIATLARAVATNGGLVSFRPRELGRHDRIEDSVSLLATTHHLILSSRHRVIQQFARQAGIRAASDWPASIEDLAGSSARALAQWLLAQMPQGAVVVLVRYPGNEACFYCDGLAPAVLPAPDSYGLESRAARIQGALLAQALPMHHAHEVCRDQADWDVRTRAVVTAAFRGTESRPWQY